MKIYNVFLDEDDQLPVFLGGKPVALAKIKERIRTFVSGNGADTHWLVVSNSTALLYLCGTIADDVLYLYAIHIFSDDAIHLPG